MAADNSHHRRRGHIRRTRNGDVVPVRDTRVKNRGRVEASEPRGVSSRDTLIGLTENDEGSDIDADDVIFALEHPEWSSRGFNRAASEPWVRRLVPPDVAEGWRDAGYTVEEAMKWREGPRGFGTVIPVEDAQKFMAAGLDALAARQLHRVAATADERIAWQKFAETVHNIDAWQSAGCKTLERAQQYCALGLTNPFDLKVMRMMDSREAHQWYEEGIELRDTLSYRRLLDEGFTVKDIAAVIKLRAVPEPGKRIDWVRSRVPAHQIPEFVRKGYTAELAAQMMEQGYTSATAPERADEP